MNWSAREYAYQGPLEPLVDIFAPFDRLASSEVCFVLAMLGALAAGVAVTRELPRRSRAEFSRGAFALASLLLAAMYCYTWGLVDEVAINLEHSYNLLHHGRFSFSPDRMVDGTVEYVYYLLLTPFAFSARSAVAAGFAFGLLIALAHLWLVAGLLKGLRPSAQTALLLLSAAFYPNVAQFSNGFGNCLVSLLFLAAIRLHFNDRSIAAAALASALPLLRPDAILYSYGLLFAMHFDARERRGWRPLSRWVYPAAALGLYLVVHRAAYGHWIPTPAAFKALHPGMLQLQHAKVLAGAVITYLAQPAWTAGVIAVMASVYFPERRTSFLRRLALPMAMIGGFYILAGRVLNDQTGDSFDRYWMPLGQTVILLMMVMLARAASWLDQAGRQDHYRIVFGRLVPALVVLLVAGGIAWQDRRPAARNRRNLAYAGQIASRVVPAGLTIATTDVNTFGLAIPDREVFDLWGYTEPAIARSRILSAARTRNNPMWFLTLRPDIFFADEQAQLANIEEFAATSLPLSKYTNMLGDMALVLEDYGVFLLRHPQCDLVLLVRQTAAAAFDRSLRQHGYALSAERAIDRATFHEIYDRERLEQVKF